MKKLNEEDLNLLALAYVLTGVEGFAVMRYIAEHKEATDDDLSLAFKVKPNVIRQTIYSLEKNHLIAFRKETDMKTNWVTFYYRINSGYFSNHTDYKKNKILEKIRKRYEYEKGHTFFSCPNKCGRVAFDEAFELNFKCNKCGQILTLDDNSPAIMFLEKVLAKAISQEKEPAPTRVNHQDHHKQPHRHRSKA
ncbi:MAG: hypothetical protein QW767_02155 [Thermoprotei archaeon]